MANSQSVTTLFGFAALDFARLFIMTPVAEFFEGAFFIELLLQTTQSAVDDFALLYANFSIHNDSPPLPDFYNCLNDFTNITCSVVLVKS